MAQETLIKSQFSTNRSKNQPVHLTKSPPGLQRHRQKKQKLIVSSIVLHQQKDYNKKLFCQTKLNPKRVLQENQN